MNDRPEEQPEENPNVGKQFEEIMGKNVTPKEEQEMKIRAHVDNIWEILGGTNDPEEQHDRDYKMRRQRMVNFPDHMVKENEDGLPHVVHYTKDKLGREWKHTWNGFAYIDHHHPKYGPIEVSNLHDYSRKWGEQPYENGLFTPHEFLKNVDEFTETAHENYKDEDLR
jgi:hypothetical protein